MFARSRYGQLFDILGTPRPNLLAPSDKGSWSRLFNCLAQTRLSGTIGDMLDQLQDQQLFALPTRVAKRERDYASAIKGLDHGETLTEPRVLAEHQKLRQVKYSEVVALGSYLEDKSVFSTTHGVKGAEFDNVVVVLGRGWSKYDFAKMLSRFPNRDNLTATELDSFVRSRNLFYVAASRAKHNLVLLFAQPLDDSALETLTGWVGVENVKAIDFDADLTPSDPGQCPGESDATVGASPNR